MLRKEISLSTAHLRRDFRPEVGLAFLEAIDTPPGSVGVPRVATIVASATAAGPRHPGGPIASIPISDEELRRAIATNAQSGMTFFFTMSSPLITYLDATSYNAMVNTSLMCGVLAPFVACATEAV
ncbi:MAG: hypothetical protein P4M07_22760 [Xanthobacteraceae bacterium]|nr:hypothetical protein [Xanthobacteraceae bacterium]